MIKCLDIESGEIHKSFDIESVCEFILSSKNNKFNILLKYTPISFSRFCEKYLKETKNYENHIKLLSQHYKTSISKYACSKL